MDNEEYINKVTLEYLLNPTLMEKLGSKYLDNNILEKDIKFYRKRICQITKDMSKDIYINDNLKLAFQNYATNIIYYLKQLDEKDIFQSEYTDIKNNEPNLFMEDISHNISSNIDNLFMNHPEPVNNLDSFVKKLNITVPDKILPKKRVANIKDPLLKIKGVKEKKNL